MIVIASHNFPFLINNLLEQFSNHNIGNHQILVIDTNSDNVDYKDNFINLKQKYPNILFHTINENCWDSGAYIYSYLNYNVDRFIFLQDSISIVNSNFIKDIDVLLNEYDVVPLYNFFPYFYDTLEQKEWVEEGIQYNNLPNDGIFGPMFGINKKIMDKISTNLLKIPKTKEQACGMERRWSLLFHSVGASKKYLVYDSNYWVDCSLLKPIYIKKITYNRNK